VFTRVLRAKTPSLRSPYFARDKIVCTRFFCSGVTLDTTLTAFLSVLAGQGHTRSRKVEPASAFGASMRSEWVRFGQNTCLRFVDLPRRGWQSIKMVLFGCNDGSTRW
jgi:hypothetical protein